MAWARRAAGQAAPRLPPASEKLTRHRERSSDLSTRTLYFTLPGGRRSSRSNVTFVDVNVPDFDGEEAWFEMELVVGTLWSWWRAVRQVEPPNR